MMRGVVVFLGVLLAALAAQAQTLPVQPAHVYYINAGATTKDLVVTAVAGSDTITTSTFSNYTANPGIIVPTPTSATVTISNASPAVVTLAGHGLVTNQAVVFATTGALPTGLTAGTTYYVISSGLTGSAFEVSATVGGSAINTSSAGSGTQSIKATPITVSTIDLLFTSATAFTMTDITNFGSANAVSGTLGTQATSNSFSLLIPSATYHTGDEWYLTVSTGGNTYNNAFQSVHQATNMAMSAVGCTATNFSGNFTDPVTQASLPCTSALADTNFVVLCSTTVQPSNGSFDQKGNWTSPATGAINNYKGGLFIPVGGVAPTATRQGYFHIVADPVSCSGQGSIYGYALYGPWIAGSTLSQGVPVAISPEAAYVIIDGLQIVPSGPTSATTGIFCANSNSPGFAAGITYTQCHNIIIQNNIFHGGTTGAVGIADGDYIALINNHSDGAATQLTSAGSSYSVYEPIAEVQYPGGPIFYDSSWQFPARIYAQGNTSVGAGEWGVAPVENANAITDGNAIIFDDWLHGQNLGAGTGALFTVTCCTGGAVTAVTNTAAGSGFLKNAIYYLAFSGGGCITLPTWTATTDASGTFSNSPVSVSNGVGCTQAPGAVASPAPLPAYNAGGWVTDYTGTTRYVHSGMQAGNQSAYTGGRGNEVYGGQDVWLFANTMFDDAFDSRNISLIDLQIAPSILDTTGLAPQNMAFGNLCNTNVTSTNCFQDSDPLYDWWAGDVWYGPSGGSTPFLGTAVPSQNIGVIGISKNDPSMPIETQAQDTYIVTGPNVMAYATNGSNEIFITCVVQADCTAINAAGQHQTVTLQDFQGPFVAPAAGSGATFTTTCCTGGAATALAKLGPGSGYSASTYYYLIGTGGSCTAEPSGYAKTDSSGTFSNAPVLLTGGYGCGSTPTVGLSTATGATFTATCCTSGDVSALAVTTAGTNYVASSTYTLTFTGGGCATEPVWTSTTNSSGGFSTTAKVTSGVGCTGTPTVAIPAAQTLHPTPGTLIPFNVSSVSGSGPWTMNMQLEYSINVGTSTYNPSGLLVTGNAGLTTATFVPWTTRAAINTAMTPASGGNILNIPGARYPSQENTGADPVTFFLNKPQQNSEVTPTKRIAGQYP